MTMCAINAAGCNHAGDIPSVSAVEFQKEIRSDSVQLLDVRTPEEYAQGHIDGAINIDVRADDFQQRAEKELKKDETVLVYCRSGRRSMHAAEILTNLGYRTVNLEGGIIDWEGSGLPTAR